MRASRLISLVLLLQTHGRLTAAQLAERLEVSVRTVYRDLDALSVAGVPVYAERGPGGGCQLVEGHRSSLAALTGHEAEALFLASLPGTAAELGLGALLAAAELKLLASLPQPVRDSANLARQRFHFDPSGWFTSAPEHPELARVASAVWGDRRIWFRYERGDGVRRTRRGDAIALVQKAELWYLVVRSDGEPRVYRVSRMLRVKVLDERFERDPRFDLEAFWADWASRFEASLPSYPVRLRATPKGVARLGRRLSSVAQPEPDGRLRVDGDFERMEYARTALLPLGAEVEVLEPPELRKELAEAAQRIVALYAS